MNYRHSYHAGNFADVFKHVQLTLLLQALRSKEAPFCYLDTHAGTARYDLQGTTAQKTGEYLQGVMRFWLRDDVIESAAPAGYLAAVRALNPDGELRYYPGSPRIARHFLRLQDRMVLMELHPEDAVFLKREFRGDKQVHVHCADGYTGLKAFLPPPEKRGLVLIDPPFEDGNEFERLTDSLRIAYQRWPTGIFALWYPLKDNYRVQHFHRQLVVSGMRKLLLAEMHLHTHPPYRDVQVSPEAGSRKRPPVNTLYGCGMIIVNPPWQMDEKLRALLPCVLAGLQPDGAGKTRVEWLVPE